MSTALMSLKRSMYFGALKSRRASIASSNARRFVLHQQLRVLGGIGRRQMCAGFSGAMEISMTIKGSSSTTRTMLAPSM
jgi:hypothetical protein